MIIRNLKYPVIFFIVLGLFEAVLMAASVPIMPLVFITATACLFGLWILGVLVVGMGFRVALTSPYPLLVVVGAVISLVFTVFVGLIGWLGLFLGSGLTLVIAGMPIWILAAILTSLGVLIAGLSEMTVKLFES